LHVEKKLCALIGGEDGSDTLLSRIGKVIQRKWVFYWVATAFRQKKTTLERMVLCGMVGRGLPYRRFNTTLFKGFLLYRFRCANKNTNKYIYDSFDGRASKCQAPPNAATIKRLPRSSFT
jgi:hypothetical protein